MVGARGRASSRRELKVVDVHFRREKHSFSLSELPPVIGFFLLAPDRYFLAMLVRAPPLALLYRRQQPLKLAFNLADFAFVRRRRVTVFYRSTRPGGIPDLGVLDGRLRRHDRRPPC